MLLRRFACVVLAVCVTVWVCCRVASLVAPLLHEPPQPAQRLLRKGRVRSMQRLPPRQPCARIVLHSLLVCVGRGGPHLSCIRRCDRDVSGGMQRLIDGELEGGAIDLQEALRIMELEEHLSCATLCVRILSVLASRLGHKHPRQRERQGVMPKHSGVIAL